MSPGNPTGENMAITTVSMPSWMQDTVSSILASAKSWPEKLVELRKLDPAVAEQFEGKLLIYSKSPPAIVVAYVLSWLVARYGIGWSPEFTSTVAGVVVGIAAYGMRYITRAPIAGVYRMPLSKP